MSTLSALLYERIYESDGEIIFFDGRWYTSRDFRKDIALVQQIFIKFGVKKGDRIALAQGNSYAFVAAYLGILLYGAVVVPVNPDVPGPELHKVLKRSHVVGALVGETLAPMLSSEVAEAQSRRESLTLQDERLSGEAPSAGYTLVFVSFGEDSNGGEGSGQVDLRQRMISLPEDSGAILLFTSGTTGTPKGVLLTHGQVMATSKNVATSHGLTDQDVCYGFLPLFHINAQVVGLLSTLTTGGRMILEPKFSASRFWVTVRNHPITWISAVPTVIAILIKSQGNAPVNHHVRFVRSASAPLPSLHARRFEARFGIPIVESYGMTEAASQICVNPVPPAKRKIGSAGIPFGVELKVVGEDDEVLGKGEIGEVVIRGESIITAYASGDDTGKSFRHGWFHTGDIGYVDSDGYLFLTGRSKEMINRAGQKISPREVEEVIGEHIGVKAVAVIGLPDDMYGERVVAYVVPEYRWKRQETLLSDELRTLCVESISAYKVPAEFHVVDEIPLGPTGKIQRNRLKQQVLTSGGVK